MIRIIYIITGLTTGGAEVMLYKLISRLDRLRFDPIVISLKDKGVWGERLESLGVPIHALNMAPGRPSIAALGKIRGLYRLLAPDLVQGWMYYGNLAASLATILSPRKVPAVWNIRQSLYSLSYEKKVTALVIKAGAIFSKYPAAIIYNSCLSAFQHAQLGFAENRTVIIPNGFDYDQFKPRQAARSKLRRILNIPENGILIGLIARYHPMKDHGSFLKAAGILLKKRDDVYFVLAGRGVEHGNPAISKLCHQQGLLGRIYLLGEQRNISELTSGLDIATSSSYYGEGFPNVVGEAMACGVPCVVTDIGDAAWIVGETGKVIPPRDPAALAKAWQELIELGPEQRQRLGKAARERVVSHFSLGQITKQYEDLYEQICGAR